MNHLKTRIFAAIIICTSLLLYFVYSKYFSHVNSQNIILSEDQEEHKRKPVDPGGIIIPHSNSLIYEKLNHGSATMGVVNLLPDPEDPMDLGLSHLRNVAGYDSIDDILAKLDLQDDDKIVQTKLVQADQDDDSANIMPNSITITPDQSPANLIPLESAATNDDLLTEKELKPNRPIDSSNSLLRITRLPEENNKLYNLNINSVDSGYKIQLSSAWSEKEAKNEWEKIQARHIKYLKNAQLIIKKVKANNGRIIYLIMAGNYSSLDQSKLICKKLTLSKQNCIVTK